MLYEVITNHADDTGTLPVVTNFSALPGRGVTGAVDGVGYTLGNHRLIHELGVCSDELEARIVITSYSIHYTKLYDELGAGTAIPSVRIFSHGQHCPVIRVNPTEWQVPFDNGVGLPVGALIGISEIGKLLDIQGD